MSAPTTLNKACAFFILFFLLHLFLYFFIVSDRGSPLGIYQWDAFSDEAAPVLVATATTVPGGVGTVPGVSLTLAASVLLGKNSLTATPTLLSACLPGAIATVQTRWGISIYLVLL